MARLSGAAAAAVCVIALTGCDNTAAPTTPATNSAPIKLGDPLPFVRADNKQLIGTVRFLEVAEIPADCVIDPEGAQTIGFRVEVDNPGVLFLSKPDVYDLKVVDRAGFTQPVTSATVRTRCGSAYPTLGPSQPGGKTTGWTFLGVRDADPAALVYSPMVGEADSTLTDLKLVAVSPTSVTVPLPVPQRGGVDLTSSVTPSPNGPAEPSTTAPTSAAPVGPSAGGSCNPAVDKWAKDASGSQLICAYAGGATPKWVPSAPYVGTRTPGDSCELGAAVAESAAGQTLVCAGDRGSSTWTPGP